MQESLTEGGRLFLGKCYIALWLHCIFGLSSKWDWVWTQLPGKLLVYAIDQIGLCECISDMNWQGIMTETKISWHLCQFYFFGPFYQSSAPVECLFCWCALPQKHCKMLRYSVGRKCASGKTRVFLCVPVAVGTGEGKDGDRWNGEMWWEMGGSGPGGERDLWHIMYPNSLPSLTQLHDLCHWYCWGLLWKVDKSSLTPPVGYSDSHTGITASLYWD